MFTDRHALVAYAQFFNDIRALDAIDWALLTARDFSRSDTDLGKVERYQAEALAHREVPVDALLGIACYSDASRVRIENMLKAARVGLQVVVERGWFFG